jgi:hypothetical protein
VGGCEETAGEIAQRLRRHCGQIAGRLGRDGAGENEEIAREPGTRLTGVCKEMTGKLPRDSAGDHEEIRTGLGQDWKQIGRRLGEFRGRFRGGCEGVAGRLWGNCAEIMGRLREEPERRLRKSLGGASEEISQEIAGLLRRQQSGDRRNLAWELERSLK